MMTLFSQLIKLSDNHMPHEGQQKPLDVKTAHNAAIKETGKQSQTKTNKE